MKSITDIMAGSALTTRLAEINVSRQTARSGLIRQYGWPETVGCAWCGDGGVSPETQRPCEYCHEGTRVADRRKRERDWSDLMPPRMQAYTLESHPDRIAAKQAARWLLMTRRTGGTLVLTGGVGTGKTGLAIALMRSAYLDGRTVQGDAWPALLDTMRPSPSATPRMTSHAYGSCGLLLIDDIGGEKVTEWAAEMLYLIANERYNAQRQTIVGTNLALDALAVQLGDRVASRLLSDADVIPMTGPDRRRMPDR